MEIMADSIDLNFAHTTRRTELRVAVAYELPVGDDSANRIRSEEHTLCEQSALARIQPRYLVHVEV
jgi:hypothetical protein